MKVTFFAMLYLLLTLIISSCSGNEDRVCMKEDYLGRYTTIMGCASSRGFTLDQSLLDSFIFSNCDLAASFGDYEINYKLMDDILNVHAVEDGIEYDCQFIKIELNCSCENNIYDPTETYYLFDVVLFDGTCWEATGQGRGLVPGPWMSNGNDIWIPCLS